MAIVGKIKPKKGFSHLFHLAFNALLPAAVYILVRINFFPLAIAMILLSKWRMFSVRPRHWPANIRANAIDIIAGFSFLVFMMQTDSAGWQMIWAGLYAFWLIVLKPISEAWGVTLQAMTGQLLGLTALFIAFSGADLAVLVLGAWAIAYASARHFLSSFDEPLTRFLSYLWGYFAAALVWVLAHWLIFYGVIAQPVLLLTVLGFGMSTLYFLHETDRLSALVRRQIVFVMAAAVLIVIIFSDWADKAV